MADAKDTEGIPKDNFNDSPEVKELYKKIRDIQSKQLKIDSKIKYVLDKKDKTATTAASVPEATAPAPATEAEAQQPAKLIQTIMEQIETFISDINKNKHANRKILAIKSDDSKSKEIEKDIDNAINIAEKSKGILEEALQFIESGNSQTVNAIKKQNALENTKEAIVNAEELIQELDIMLIEIASKADENTDHVEIEPSILTNITVIKEQITTALDKAKIYAENQKKNEDENANEKKNILVLLNNLINEASIISMASDKRYLYTIKYKATSNETTDIFENEDKKYKRKELEKPKSDDTIYVPTATVVPSAPELPPPYELSKNGINGITSGGSINDRLSFLATSIGDMKDLKYKNLFIVEYSTENVKEIDKNITQGEQGPEDLYQYIANFQEYINNNNRGKKINYADRTKDRSLSMKEYSIAKYFATFNRNNGFDYKGFRNAYTKDIAKYTKAINNYEKLLDVFLKELENYRENNNLNFGFFQTNFNFNINYILSNYYGFIIIIVILITLFGYYLSTFTSFVNSVYQRKLSLEPSIIDDSMFAGYAEIRSMYVLGFGESYHQRKDVAIFFAYLILFIFVVMVNIYNISDALQGRLRVWNFIPIPFYSTQEFYIFDKRANFVMYYGIIMLIFIILFNIIYYASVFSRSDIFETRYESNKELQGLYDEMDKSLLTYLLNNDIIEFEGVTLNTIDLKLARWMYGETEKELDKRIGNTSNIEETKKLRFKILLTVVFVKHYAGLKYKKELSKITDIEADPLPNVFLHSKSQLLDGVLPQNFKSILSDSTINIIKGPTQYYKDKQKTDCDKDKDEKDKRYFCKSTETANANAYDLTLSSSNIDSYFNTEYRKVYKRVQEARRKIRSKDSVMLYKIDIILAFIFMLLIGLCLIQIVLWIFNNIDVYEMFFIKYKSKLQTIFQIIVVIVILIVIL